MRRYRSTILVVASILTVIFIWWIVSLFYRPEFLPSPFSVFQTVVKLFATGKFFFHMYKTLIRILIGFTLAMVLSTFLGVVMGISKYVEKFFEAEVLIGLTIPALCWAAISIMWFGLKDASAIFAIIALITPMITVNILQGMKALDKDVIEMGKAFKSNKKMIIQHIVLPQLVPYFFASIRFGLGLAWKVVVIAEMMGLSNGIGYMISFWFGLFSMKDVLAWTISFTLVMFVIEYGIIRSFEKRFTRWRPVTAF